MLTWIIRRQILMNPSKNTSQHVLQMSCQMYLLSNLLALLWILKLVCSFFHFFLPQYLIVFLLKCIVSRLKMVGLESFSRTAGASRHSCSLVTQLHTLWIKYYFTFASFYVTSKAHPWACCQVYQIICFLLLHACKLEWGDSPHYIYIFS